MICSMVLIAGNTFAFLNSEQNIGVNLVVFENEEMGLYEIKLEFPPEYRRVNKTFMNLTHTDSDEIVNINYFYFNTWLW